MQKTELYQIGPFHVSVQINETGEVEEARSNCDCTSRVSEQTHFRIFEEPTDEDFEEIEQEYCQHEYAAMTLFYEEMSEKVRKEFETVEKLE